MIFYCSRLLICLRKITFLQIMDENLNWTNHTSHIQKKCSKAHKYLNNKYLTQLFHYTVYTAYKNGDMQI